MTRRRGGRPLDDREELLAAHVSGGLDGDEAAEVEALLAESPEARAEADEIARLLTEVRAAEPRPAEEPDWVSMARAIQRACAEDGGEARATPGEAARPGWTSRLRAARWLAARPALRWPAGVVGAAGVAALILFLTRPAPTATTSRGAEPRAAVDPRSAGDARGSEPTAATAAEASPEPGDALGEGDDGLDEGLALDPLGAAPVTEGELADLELALDGDLGEASSFIADLLADSSEEGASVDREAADGGAQELALDREPVDPFRAADPSALDRLADELDDQDLEALDRFLAEVHAG